MEDALGIGNAKLRTHQDPGPEAVLCAVRVVRLHLDDTGWANLAAAVGIDPHLGGR